jgi:hypothetical protein
MIKVQTNIWFPIILLTTHHYNLQNYEVLGIPLNVFSSGSLPWNWRKKSTLWLMFASYLPRLLLVLWNAASHRSVFLLMPCILDNLLHIMIYGHQGLCGRVVPEIFTIRFSLLLLNQQPVTNRPTGTMYKAQLYPLEITQSCRVICSPELSIGPG